jgi:hypothetical protein
MKDIDCCNAAEMGAKPSGEESGVKKGRHENNFGEAE